MSQDYILQGGETMLTRLQNDKVMQHQGGKFSIFYGFSLRGCLHESGLSFDLDRLSNNSSTDF